MKNVMLLGLIAAVLFAVSAGMSLWLYQPKPGEEATAKGGKGKTSAAGGEGVEKAPATPRSIAPPLPNGDVSEAARLTNQLQVELARIAKREEDLDQQQELYRVVLEDIRGEMDALQKLWLKAPASKRPVARPGDASKPGPTAPAPSSSPPLDSKVPNPADSAEKNLKMVTGISESMPAESAARIIEQMAKAGKSDTVVQLLSRMQARHVARILGQVQDEKLAVELIEKLLDQRRSTGDPPPANER